MASKPDNVEKTAKEPGTRLKPPVVDDVTVKETVEKTAKEPGTRRKPPVIDDVTVKETFADDFLGLYAVGPNFHLNFGARRPVRGTAADKPNVASVVSARVVIPLEAAVELYMAIGGVVENLEKRGVVRRIPPAQKG